jgi:hypothetical protein
MRSPYRWRFGWDLCLSASATSQNCTAQLRGYALDGRVLTLAADLTVVYLGVVYLGVTAETEFKYRCKQVNLVQRTNVEGEEEFLVSERRIELYPPL